MDTSVQILNNISEAIILVDRYGKIQFVNPQFEQLLGYGFSQIVGKSLNVLIPEVYAGMHDQMLQRYFSSPEYRKMGGGRTVHGRTAQGEDIPLEISLSLIPWEDGQVAMAILKDQSELMASKKEIEKSKEIYESMFQNSGDHLMRLNLDFEIEYINHVADGLGFFDVMGKSILEFSLTQRKKDEVKKVLNEVVHTGKPQTYEADYYAESGLKYYSVSVSPIFYRDKIYGVSLAARDLSSEIQLQKSLKENQLLLDKIDKNSFNGIYIYDIQKERNTFINKQYTNILGYTQEDIENTTPEAFLQNYHPEDFDSIIAYFAQMSQLQKGECLENVYRMRTKSGEWKWIYSKDTAFEYDHTGAMVSFMGAFVEITALKKAEAELLQKNKELENFAYIAAHDLKAPINTLKGFLTLMEDYDEIKANEDISEFLNLSITSVERMQDLIQVLLDYSSLGKDLKFEPARLKYLVDDVLIDLKDVIDSTGAQIKVGSLPQLPFVSVSCLRRVFQNLIANSIKFRKAQVPMIIQIKAKEQDDHYIISIEDNGIGIKQEHLPGLFNLFQKIHSRSKYDGHGIGLSSCKKIIQLHQGDIWVESEFGVGTTFKFTLPKFYQG